MIQAREAIVQGKTSLGIELGSTRIKAILISEEHKPIASGCYEWENKLENNIWTYSLEEIWKGVQGSYSALLADIKEKHKVSIETIGSIGISGMMHGYMVFDNQGELLVPFRTWRNTITQRASKELSELFNFHIPQRWSIAHLYEALLNDEEHVKDITYMTTLAGYIHWKLTGKNVLGIGEASGVFPIDSTTKDYDLHMIQQFNEKVISKNLKWKIEDILPKVLVAGEEAGVLTEEGAKLLDVTGDLKAGSLLCPPEGDAGTGMVATNSIGIRTGNVSAGTSVFAMLVLEKQLSKAYEEIDLVTTPTGHPVAMVHCNNCTTDLNAWVDLFKELTDNLGINVDKNKLFTVLYNKALEGDADCGGLLAYNYFSCEHITQLAEGRPIFVRTPNSRFDLANFMRVHLFTALGALKVGLDILMKQENVQVDEILGHGGLFKTKGVGQRILAAAINVPISVMEIASEGGAWGIAILAAYMKNRSQDETLESYLKDKIFCKEQSTRIEPNPTDVAGFEVFIKRYLEGLAIEKAAIEALK